MAATRHNPRTQHQKKFDAPTATGWQQQQQYARVGEDAPGQATWQAATVAPSSIWPVVSVVSILTLVGVAGFVLALVLNGNTNVKIEEVNDLVSMTVDSVMVFVPVGGSLRDAISQLGNGSLATECIIQLEGDLDLGTDPDPLCFFPAVRQCKHIVIQGPRENLVVDTVASIEQVDPDTLKWDRVTGTTGGYTAGLYERHFIENVAQSRVYVVDNNNAENVTTIAGVNAFINGDTLPSLDLPPTMTQGVAWELGDQFELFTISRAIRWSGNLLLDIPFGKVTFRYLHFDPVTVGSSLRTPDGPEHRVIFRGCRLDTANDTPRVGGYNGAMLMLGVYSDAPLLTAGFPIFVAYQRQRCPQMESVWVRSGASHSQHAIRVVEQGQMIAAAVTIFNSVGPGINAEGNSQLNLRAAMSYNTAGIAVDVTGGGAVVQTDFAVANGGAGGILQCGDNGPDPWAANVFDVNDDISCLVGGLTP